MGRYKSTTYQHFSKRQTCKLALLCTSVTRVIKGFLDPFSFQSHFSPNKKPPFSLLPSYSYCQLCPQLSRQQQSRQTFHGTSTFLYLIFRVSKFKIHQILMYVLHLLCIILSGGREQEVKPYAQSLPCWLRWLYIACKCILFVSVFHMLTLKDGLCTHCVSDSTYFLLQFLWHNEF